MKEIKPENLITGDQLLTRSDTFLSETIRDFMSKYARQHSLNVHKCDLYSHAEFVINEHGAVRVAGAIKNGYNIRPLDGEYGINSDNVMP